MSEEKQDPKSVAKLINEIERMIEKIFESFHYETGIIINEAVLNIKRDSTEYLYYEVKLKMVSDFISSD